MLWEENIVSPARDINLYGFRRIIKGIASEKYPAKMAKNNGVAGGKEE